MTATTLSPFQQFCKGARSFFRWPPADMFSLICWLLCAVMVATFVEIGVAAVLVQLSS